MELFLNLARFKITILTVLFTNGEWLPFYAHSFLKSMSAEHFRTNHKEITDTSITGTNFSKTLAFLLC